MPGVPQVYYVGLLAGENDMALLAQSGVGRDINRHHFRRDEIDAGLHKAVVARLLQLIRLRNEHPAFSGNFELLESDTSTLAMRWQQGMHTAALCITLPDRSHRLSFSDGGASMHEFSLAV